MKLKSILFLAILMCFAILTANAATNYYQCWIASGGGVTCQNLEGGHYTVNWSTSTDWVAGKGWNPCNNANMQWTGGCSACNYFGVYGWLSSPLVEYYIGRGGGSSAGSYSTSRGSYTLNSYNCNGPNITGNGAFIQYNCSGAGSSPINLGEHFTGWKGLGKQVNTQNYCMVAAEAWSGSGTADVTVSEASGTTAPTAVPTTAPTPVNGTISIACGSSSAVGSFEADSYFSGGTAYANTNTIDVSQITDNPPQAALFNNERYGAFNYTIPGFNASTSYAVTLYFAETYLTSAGSRVFNVSISGTTVLSNFDIYSAAGGQNKAIAQSFTVTPNSSGQIVITLSTGTENPKINGIAIKPGSSPTTVPTAVPTTVPTTPPACPLKGDVNGSGAVDVVDALMIAQCYVGMCPSNYNSACADVNCSGAVDIVDALLIAQMYVGLISNFPC
jgi:endo-1,4-beta-xylanase